MVANDDDDDDACAGEGESRTPRHRFGIRVRTCNSTKLETCCRFKI